MVGEKLGRLRPESGNRGGGIVEVDREAVRLVVVLHEAEDVVVDVAKEVHLGLDAPVVLCIGQGGMLVKQTTVPAAHLMVGHLVGILNVVLLEDLD